jgi:hypothetical protein
VSRGDPAGEGAEEASRTARGKRVPGVETNTFLQTQLISNQSETSYIPDGVLISSLLLSQLSRNIFFSGQVFCMLGRVFPLHGDPFILA